MQPQIDYDGRDSGRSRTPIVAVLCFALGVFVGLTIGPLVSGQTPLQEEVERLREEKRLLQELVAEQKAQLDDINAGLEPAGDRTEF